MTIFTEIHNRICGQHLRGKSLTKKALRGGYYWPTMTEDARRFVKKCDKCQHHDDIHIAPLLN